MPILKNLTFTSVPARSHDPVAARRAKLVERLEEQKQLLANASYVRTIQRWALPTNGWYMSWIDPFNAGPYNPSVNSQIAQNMQACASPGLYFEVSPTDGISAAMTALFQKAVQQARLTK